MKKVIMNETKENKHILTLNGFVGGKGWFDDEFISAKDVRKSLDDVTTDIVIKLNSPGGDVFAGVEIYNYLKSLKNKVTIEVTGVAASAASLIAMSGDEVVMRTGATMMIHEASTFAYGNKKEIQKTLNALEAIDDSIADIYVERTSLSHDEVSNMLNEETWLTADEAIKLGFADTKSSVKADKVGKKQVDNLIKFTAFGNEDTDELEDIKDRLTKLENRVAELEAEKTEETEDEEEPIENNSNWLFF